MVRVQLAGFTLCSAIQIVVILLLFFIGYTSLLSITRWNNQPVGRYGKRGGPQLGTPISSLLGWIQLFRDDLPKQVEQGTVNEIEKDVYRLKG